jgi:hypothetical protein
MDPEFFPKKRGMFMTDILPGYWAWLKLVLVALALIGWLRFVYRSVKEDYGRFVQGTLLEPSKIFKVL